MNPPVLARQQSHQKSFYLDRQGRNSLVFGQTGDIWLFSTNQCFVPTSTTPVYYVDTTLMTYDGISSTVRSTQDRSKCHNTVKTGKMSNNYLYLFLFSKEEHRASTKCAISDASVPKPPSVLWTPTFT